MFSIICRIGKGVGDWEQGRLQGGGDTSSGLKGSIVFQVSQEKNLSSGWETRICRGAEMQDRQHVDI